MSLLWGMSVLQLIVVVLSINLEAKSFNFLFSNAFASHWVFKWFKMSVGFNCTVLISIFYVYKQHEHLFFVSIAFNFTYTKRDGIFLTGCCKLCQDWFLHSLSLYIEYIRLAGIVNFPLGRSKCSRHWLINQ